LARPGIVVIGASQGSLMAFTTILRGLPDGFGAAVVLASHQRPGSGGRLSSLLSSVSALPIADVHDKESVAPGRVYLAPADYHLLVAQENFALSIEAHVHFTRPSIDILFETAAEAFGDRTTGVILTGNGRDGAAGLARITALGGLAVIQDPATAEARGMPDAALETVPQAEVLPLEQITPFLVKKADSADE